MSCNKIKRMARSKAEAKEKLTGSEFITLALIDKGFNYGLDIVDKSHGLVNRGTVYNTLQRFCGLGFLDSTKKVERKIVDKANREKMQFVATYKLTEEGKRVLKNNHIWLELTQTLFITENDNRKKPKNDE